MNTAQFTHSLGGHVMAKARGGFLWWLPNAPKAPDYSTPEAVTLRAFERGSNPTWTLRMFRFLLTDGKVYRDFRAALDKAGR